MTLPELEALRGQSGISKCDLCRESGVNQSTYGRWMRAIRGERGGCLPNVRNLDAVKAALKRRLCAPNAAIDRIAS